MRRAFLRAAVCFWKGRRLLALPCLSSEKGQRHDRAQLSSCKAGKDETLKGHQEASTHEPRLDMVVRAHASSPADGTSSHAHAAVDPRDSDFPGPELPASKAAARAGIAQGPLHTDGKDCADDGEDDGSLIHQPTKRSSLEETVGSDVSFSSSEEDDGLDVREVGFASDPSCRGGSTKRPLKPALKRSTSEYRARLRVQWAPDVYDPLPSMASHTKGRNKPTLVTRRSRRAHNSKAGHGKGKKHGKGDNKARKQSGPPPPPATVHVSTCVSPPPPLNLPGDEPVPFEDCVEAPADEAGNIDSLEGTCAGVDALTLEETDGSSTVEPKDASPASSDARDGSEVTEEDVDAKAAILATTASSSEPLADPADMEESKVPAKASSKKRSKRSSSGAKSPPSPQREAASAGKDSADKDLLDEVAHKRLGGATALASGDVETAKKLLLCALVGARHLKSSAEQARCLRMLADTQQSRQRENSLAMAVSCFASTALAFERAEAMLCLAQHMVQQQLDAACPRKGAWPLHSPRSSWISDEASTSRLQAAKGYLHEAATLLLANHMAGPAAAAGGAGGRPSGGFESPTGRRRRAKGQQLAAAELTQATVVMGSICEVWGKVCLLLREYDEAHAQLSAAARNSLWRTECPEEHAQVQQLLEALDAGPTVAARIPQACTVY